MMQDAVSKGHSTGVQSPSARPNIIMLACLLYFLFVPDIILDLIVRPIINTFELDVSFIVFHVIYLFIAFGIPVLVYALYLTFSKQRISPAFYIKSLDKRNLICIIILTLTFSFVVNPFLFEIPAILGAPPLHIPERNLAQVIISGIVAVSIFEEFMFRGFLINEYQNQRIAIWKIALATGLFFGLIHHGFQGILFTAINGFLWAYMLYLTRSIWAVLISHMLANSGAFWHPALYIRNLETYQAVMPVYAVVIIIITVVSIPVFIVFLRKFIAHNRREKEALPKETASFTWTYWVLIVAMLVAIILFRV